MSESEKKELDRVLDGVDVGRRDFLRKVVLTTAFTVPLVSSFAIDGMVVSKAFATNLSNVS
jgi:hypothetical protein